jgi:hypothetical protein
MEVQVSSGLIFAKPSSLGFTALRIPFHRDPYHWPYPLGMTLAHSSTFIETFDP